MVLPGGRQLVLAGRVAWVRDPYEDELSPGVGVRFEPLDADDRRAIERFLSQRAPMFFEA
jgi:Tfp pilus assembly protein PilZ